MTAMNSRELDSFIGELVRFYGVERAIYVLSRTIQFSDWDSRFGQAVLDRAGQTDFPDARTPRDENHVDPTTRYVTEIDPCVANAIFMKLMELEEEQEATAQMENDGQKELDEDMALEMTSSTELLEQKRQLPMAQMTFLDFFSGIGGFRKGFELCGMRCVGHCEIDKYADRSYRAIHNVKDDVC